MEYRMLEMRLAKLHRVDEEGLGALRARLRVLRAMGIPQMPKLGKGARAQFGVAALAELHLALTMSEFGLPPSRIAQLMSYIRHFSSAEVWPPKKANGQWLAITLMAPAGNLTDISDEDGFVQIAFLSDERVIGELRFLASGALKWHSLLNLDRFAEDLWDNDLNKSFE